MRVLAFQHTNGEHPAAFAKQIKAAGDDLTVVRLDLGETIPDLIGFDILIVMGGPMDVWETQSNPWLLLEKQAIKTWVHSGRPLLGVCLGHQLLVDALGGQCGVLPSPQIKVAEVVKTAVSDPIFDKLPPRFPVMQWNGVGVIKLPANTKVLAKSEGCSVQAIRVGENAWGVQFHPEITDGLVTSWLEDSGNWDCAVAWLGSASKASDFAKASETHVADAMRQSLAMYQGLRAAARKKT